MKKESICVAVDRNQELGVVTPIYPSTAFQYVDEGPQYYPRYFNTPNQDAVVEKLAKLEKAETGVLFGSGMSAISTTMMTLLKPRDHVVCLEGLYGGTHKFILTEFERLGIEYSFASAEIDDLDSACKPNSQVIYVESPTNPTMTLVDLQAVAQLARARGLVSVIDNTFASPICQNPIDHGIDIVTHSGTKYLGGHSDLSCGAALGRSEHIDPIRAKALQYGGVMNSITCYLVERSLKTLALRVERQSKNALAIAKHLEQHPAVNQVCYPGLESNADHEVARRQMDPFGGMMSFALGDAEQVQPFLKALKLITPALSLGGVESTVCVPRLTSHRGVDKAELERVGVTDSLIRYSVGIEHVDDLIDDLDQALAAVSKMASV